MQKLWVITLVLIMSSALFSEQARAESLSCFRCGKNITQNHIKAGNLVFHPSCFICAVCGKALNAAVTLDGSKPCHPDCYARAQGLMCGVCGKILEKTWVELDGKKYHPGCYTDKVQLRCDICGKAIDGKYIRDGGVYHKSCYKTFKLDPCVICLRPIEGSHIKDAWGNTAHGRHDGQEVDLCESCGRIISKTRSDGGVRYGDGRIICGICSRTAVLRLDHLEPARSEVLALFSTVGVGGIPVAVPVTLVDKDELKRLGGKGYSDSARGFTLSSVRTEHGIVQRNHSIFILSGLPGLEFKGVLAHELFHVWLNEKKIRLSDRETEGFCNLGVMLVYASDPLPLARVLERQMEQDSDPLYGKGYRIMKKKLDRIGWPGLIENVLSSR